MNSSFILFSPGVSVEGEFSFSSTNKDKNFPLKIIKEETTELTYQVAIKYLGINELHRPQWTVELSNDVNRHTYHSSYEYDGSRKFVFKPIGKRILEIEETDENNIEKTWINIAVNPHLQSDTPPTADDPIQLTIEKVKKD